MMELDGMHDEEIKLTLHNMLPHGHRDMGPMPILFFNIRLLDGTKIGKCDLRVGNSDITEILGHVGYEIDESYQGHHYAAKACRLLMAYAAKTGMKEITITCDDDNIPSRKTCEWLGMTLTDIFPVPDGIKAYDYKNGSGIKCRYRAEL